MEGEGLTMPEAEALETRLELFQNEISNPDSKLGQAIFPHRRYRRIAYDSSLSTVVTAAKQTVSGIQAPVELLSSAGSLVAVAVIAAAAVFAMARRRVEATLLYARGMSPFRIGLKSALESLLPVAVGTALGLGVAVASVRLLGPGGAADGEALREAAKAVALRLPVAVALLGLVAACRLPASVRAHDRALRTAEPDPVGDRPPSPRRGRIPEAELPRRVRPAW